MSRLWPDDVGVYLSPARICLVRLRRGLRRKLLREETISVVSKSAGWESPLAALQAKLADEAWSNSRVGVVVSDHWVRYAAIPHVADLRGAEEQQSHARALLASIYGEAVNDWSLCLSDAPPGASRVACVVPAPLLSELQAICSRNAVKLISVQPQLVASYNSWRHCLPKDGAWFVTVESGALGAARVGAAGIERIHTVRIGEDWMRELKRLQTFGRLAQASGASTRVFVDAPISWRPAGMPPSEDLHWLEQSQPPLTALHRLEHLRRMAA